MDHNSGVGGGTIAGGARRGGAMPVAEVVRLLFLTGHVAMHQLVGVHWGLLFGDPVTRAAGVGAQLLALGCGMLSMRRVETTYDDRQGGMQTTCDDPLRSHASHL